MLSLEGSYNNALEAWVAKFQNMKGKSKKSSRAVDQSISG